MNADDEKKLDELYILACKSGPIYDTNCLDDALRKAFDLGRRAGMTEAAGVASDMAHGYSHGLTRDEHEVLTDCAAAIEKARDS